LKNDHGDGRGDHDHDHDHRHRGSVYERRSREVCTRREIPETEVFRVYVSRKSRGGKVHYRYLMVLADRKIVRDSGYATNGNENGCDRDEALNVYADASFR